MFVSGRRQGRLWETAHSWLHYSWPQNKKAAPSIYRPQDDYKSHRPGPRPGHSSPTLPASSTCGRSPAALLCPWGGSAHGCPCPGRPRSIGGPRVVLQGPGWRQGPQWCARRFGDTPPPPPAFWTACLLWDLSRRIGSRKMHSLAQTKMQISISSHTRDHRAHSRLQLF